MFIEVVRADPDKVHRQVWTFTVLCGHGSGPLVLRLDHWAAQMRPTPRHNWKQDGEAYIRRSHNGIVHYAGMRLPAAQVPFPDDVLAEAREIILSRLKVTGPEDPPNRG